MQTARPLGLALTLLVIGTLVVGIYPRPFVALGQRAAISLHLSNQDLAANHLAPNPCHSPVAETESLPDAAL